MCYTIESDVKIKIFSKSVRNYNDPNIYFLGICMKMTLLKVSKIRSARVDVHRYKPYLKACCVKIYGLFLLAVPKFFAPKISQSLKTRNFAYLLMFGTKV